jgi:hypothetical protein
MVVYYWKCPIYDGYHISIRKPKCHLLFARCKDYFEGHYYSEMITKSIANGNKLTLLEPTLCDECEHLNIDKSL